MDVEKYITDGTVEPALVVMDDLEYYNPDHEVRLVLRAVLPGILAQRDADVLREAADEIEASVPPTVFPPDGTSQDCLSAKLRRADCHWLRRLADEAVAQ